MADEVIIRLHIVPGSKKDQVCGFMEDGRLKIKIAAKAADGKANERLVGYLSDVFGIKKSAISIQSGEFSRNKRVSVIGVETKIMQDSINRVLNQDP